MSSTREMIYDICVQSYAFGINRIDAMNARTQTAITVSSTLTVAYAVLVQKASGNGYWDALLYLVGGFYLAGLVLGMASIYQTGKSLSAPQPETLKDHYLDKSPEEFQTALIDSASRSFVNNFKVVDMKHKLTMGLIACFGLQIICMFLWLTVRPS